MHDHEVTDITVLASGPQPGDIFGAGKIIAGCNFLFCLITKHDFENCRECNCPVATHWVTGLSLICNERNFLVCGIQKQINFYNSCSFMQKI